MLTVHHDSASGQTRLVIRGIGVEAWIAPCPPPQARAQDWRLWTRPPRPGAVASPAKCQLRLLIESRLRAWLLQRFRRRLSDLRFEQLREIAQLQQRKMQFR
jgi:hypothetical protein